MVKRVSFLNKFKCTYLKKNSKEYYRWHADTAEENMTVLLK
jgi:hypothetical protein